ncbi:MAG: hypothetical protein R6X23_15895 [Acidimicrobiia bacterium]
MRRTLSVLVAVLGLTLVPLGGAESAYSDPAGDSGSGPDITAVTVSDAETGIVTMRIAVSLEPWTAVFLAMDTDRNPMTGEFGLDGFVGVVMGPAIEDQPSQLSVVALDEDMDELPGVSLSATFDAGVLAFSFPRESFSIDQAFAFGLISMSGIFEGRPTVGDTAPADPCWMFNVPCSRLWVYELTGVAPAPPTPVAVKPIMGKAVATPKQPIAGKRFTVTFPVTASTTGAPLAGAKLSCTTKVAGKVVPHVHAYTTGKAKATLLVPKTGKGKQLKVSAKVTANGQTATKVVTYKIR